MPIDNILSSNLGLQSLLDPAQAETARPEPKTLSSNVVTETGLDRHFDLAGVNRLLDKALIPENVDERLLRPDVFKRNLSEAFEKLKEGKDPSFRRLVRDDLAPIMEDSSLYDLYANLLVQS